MSTKSELAFAEELAQLLLRWTRQSSNSKAVDKNVALLTDSQVRDIVKNVMSAILEITLPEIDNSSVKTPASGISICTPNAPVVSKPNGDRNSSLMARYRSLDTLTDVEGHQSDNRNFQCTDKLSSRSEESLDAMDSDNANIFSIPAINISAIKRSDTFVREEDIDKDSKNTNEVFDNFENSDSGAPVEPKKMRNSLFLQKLETLKRNASEMLSQIDDMKKIVCPQPTKPIRRLSSIGFSGVNRSSPLMKPVPPSKLRRYSTTFPGTPTSSKLNLTVTTSNEQYSEGSVFSKASNTPKKSKISKMSPALSETKINAPGKQSISPTFRLPKNPKYAHVQSTIPKATIGKRKSQS